MAEDAKKSVFETLNAISFEEKVDRKGNVSYIPWAEAWSELKKLYPDVVAFRGIE